MNGGPTRDVCELGGAEQAAARRWSLWNVDVLVVALASACWPFIQAEEEEDALLSAHVHSTSGRTRERTRPCLGDSSACAGVARLRLEPSERQNGPKGIGTFCDLS